MASNKDPELAKDDLHVTTSLSSSKNANAPVPVQGTTQHLPTYEHERALTLKFDLRILPVLSLMYLFNALDKGNLGMDICYSDAPLSNWAWTNLLAFR